MKKGVLIDGITSNEIQQNFDKINEKLNLLSNNIVLKQEPELITRHETAKILQVSLSTLLNWRKAGIITPYRIGNKIRYKKSEILESLQKINSKNN